MFPMILAIAVISQVPDAPRQPQLQRGELAAPEGLSRIEAKAVEQPSPEPEQGGAGPVVPYPAGDPRAELLSPEFGVTAMRFVARHGLVVIGLGAIAFGALGGYIAIAKRRPIAEGLVIGGVFGPIGVLVVGMLPESKGQGA